MIIDLNNWQPTAASGFIVLEGSNGGGKTTQQKKICSYFQELGLQTLTTREPGAGPLGAELRKLTLSSEIAINPLSELFLFEADRAQHVSSIIKPALANKSVVISDRYYYSSEAFQGYGRGLDLELIRNLNNIAIQELKPDLVILLDLDPITGLQRTSSRNQDSTLKERDRFEEVQLEFHNKVRQGFLEIAKNTSEAFLVVDASQDIEAIWKTIKQALDKISPCLK